jgi:hypothetical protein
MFGARFPGLQLQAAVLCPGLLRAVLDRSWNAAARKSTPRTAGERERRLDERARILGTDIEEEVARVHDVLAARRSSRVSEGSPGLIYVAMGKYGGYGQAEAAQPLGMGIRRRAGV